MGKEVQRRSKTGPIAKLDLKQAETGGIDGLCGEYAAGASLRAMAEKYEVSYSVMYAYMTRAENVEKYTAAKSMKADLVMEEVMEIVDDPELGEYIDDNGNTRVDTGAVNRARLRVENRRFLAGKLDPAKYGDDKTPVNVNLNLGDMHVNALRAKKNQVIDG